MLACGRRTLDESGLATVQRLLVEGPDWEQVFREAEQHGLTALLAHHLLASSLSVPAGVRTRLVELQSRTVRKNLVMTGELIRIVQALKTSGIEAVPYKGPALAAELYSDIALREFSDLDVFVPRPQAIRAVEILKQSGYEAAGISAATLRVANEHSLHHQQHGLYVELIWAAAPPQYGMAINPTFLWNDLREIEVSGHKVAAFSAEALLLLLCIHGAKDLWSRAIWIADLAELLRACSALDWARVEKEAKHSGARRAVRLGLSLAHELFGAELPREQQQDIEGDSELPALRASVYRSWETAADREAPSEWFPFYLAVQDGAAARQAFVTRLAVHPSPGDVATLQLPERFFVLYHFIRPIRWAGNLVQRLFARPSNMAMTKEAGTE